MTTGHLSFQYPEVEHIFLLRFFKNFNNYINFNNFPSIFHKIHLIITVIQNFLTYFFFAICINYKIQEFQKNDSLQFFMDQESSNQIIKYKQLFYQQMNSNFFLNLINLLYFFFDICHLVLINLMIYFFKFRFTVIKVFMHGFTNQRVI